MSERTPGSVRIEILGRPEWPEPQSFESAACDPDVVREAEVAIVGGGPSGLVAAYRLRNLDVLLMERESEVGGNARADAWRNVVYPAGAIVTYARSPAMNLYDELGLTPERIAEAVHGNVLADGRRLEGELWGSVVESLYSPTAVRAIRRARRDLLDSAPEANRERLDRVPFSSLLREYPPEVKDWLDRLLRWFACTTEEISAYVGVYLARSQMGEGLGVLYPEGTSEGGTYSFPGGLSRPALALREAFEQAGADRVWTGATVYSVDQDEHGAWLRGVRSGQRFSIHARCVVLAASKHVARRIVRNIPADQRAAMEAITYVPYLVGAVGSAEALAPDLALARVLDGPMATVRDLGGENGFRLLRLEFPFGAPGFPASLRTEDLRRFGQDVIEYLNGLFPGARQKVEELRLWRRGHNWYVPVPGFVTGAQGHAARPLGRIYFANADSVGPISEFGWALVAADRAAEAVRRRLADEGG